MLYFENELNNIKKLKKLWEKLSPEMVDRRILVKSLKLRNISNEAIAKAANVSVRTIERDLQWFREKHKEFEGNFVSGEQVGASIEFYQEIENKCMIAATEALKTEKLIDIKNKNGKIVKSMSLVPDHNSAGRYFAVALQARDKANKLLQDVGMLRIVPEKVNDEDEVDLSKMGIEELEVYEKELQEKIKKIEEDIERIDSPNPFTDEEPL